MASAEKPLPVVTYERTPGAASAALPPAYRPRRLTRASYCDSFRLRL